MGGKQILGDDPFASESSDETAPPPPAEGAAKPSRRKAKSAAAEPRKRRKEASAAEVPAAAPSEATEASAPPRTAQTASPEATEAAAPPRATQTTASQATEAAAPPRTAQTASPEATDASAPPRAAQTASPGAGEQEASERYSAVESSPPSEYGPSIDRPPPSGHRHGLLDEVRQIERSVRDRLLPARAGEHGGERNRLPLEFLWRRWRKLAMRDRSDVVDEFGRDPQVAARVDPLLQFLYKSYFRVEPRGLGHIPDSGRALIVANHSGTLPYDGAMIMHAIKTEHRAHREVRPLVENFVFHFPYLGTLMNRIGGVRACPENAERLLMQDQLVAVFPEGIKGIGKLYKERYQLQRFGRGGFIKLALKCDAPIIPTAIVGAEEIHPMIGKITWLARTIGIPYLPITPTFPWLGPLGALPLPTKWYLVFGEPLYFNAEYGAEGAQDRILVNKLAEQVRTRIQEMLDELLKQRKSILFG